MVAVLPDELLQLITQDYPCRDAPIRELATFYNGIFPSPPVLVAYGLEQSTKLGIISGLLKARGLRYALVKSRDCLSQRHLLSKIFAASLNAFDEQETAEQYEKVDSLNALLFNLQRLLAGRNGGLVLVLDGIDRQKGAGPTLLPALAKVGDQISSVSVIMTSNSPRPLHLHKSGVPYVHFAPYSRVEAIHLITHSPPPLKPTSPPAQITNLDSEELAKIYAHFAVAVYDSLVVSTSSTSIPTFRQLCEKLWPRFIWPLLSGETPPGKTMRWDFARLLVRNRALFQADGENALVDRLQPQPSILNFTELQKQTEQQNTAADDLTTLSNNRTDANPHKVQPRSRIPPLLKHFSTLLLVSAYLASHTHQKHDIILFSRLSSSSSSSKKTRKGHQQKKKLLQSSTQQSGPGGDGEGRAGGEASSSSKPSTSSTPKVVRSLFDSKLGVARPFGLERLVAILRAIHPHGVPHRKGVADRVYRELGELERLRLVMRASGATGTAAGSGSGGGGGGGDDAEEKWKINVGRDWVVAMGKIWGLGVAEYEVLGGD